MTVNKAEAGQGSLTCHVTNTTTSTEVKTTVIDNYDGTVSIKYVPTVAGTYTMDLKYGGVTLPAGRIIQQVRVLLFFFCTVYKPRCCCACAT